jgi:hemoglobin
MISQRTTRLAMALLLAASTAGCGGGEKKHDPNFFTSGNREADQRAEQTMAKSEQLSDEKNATSSSPLATPKKSLYDRVGGDVGLTQIVDDFVTRAMADPRVNFNRKGVTTGGFVGIDKKSAEWDPTPAQIAQVKKHLVQFLALATGGPSKYDGQDMKTSHAGMKISNTEFDAAIGDMKVTLDRFNIATTDQKELLAVLESTRTQIVEVR